ncbi:MAG: pyridoxal phosphate-dependent aminotransferase [Fibrobacter sp.]|jgi:aspartate aminotransferase|nr:pyridoxal phosphate-dependent aminotransferase [Fibrobacter sp.]
MKPLSKHAQNISPSLTVAIDTLAKNLIAQGKKIISLAAGEPDSFTPDFIKNAAIEAIQTNQTRYTNPAGIEKVREAVCHKLKRDHSLVYTPGQIVMTSGAKHAVFNALQVILNEGDEVIIPSPYWVTYPELVRFLGGVPVFVETLEQENYLMNAAALENAITPKTKCLILNQPCNPTGAVYSRNQLEQIAKVLVKHDLYCISDEVYEYFTYGEEFHSMAAVKGMQERTILVNGFSKSYSMTGWRIGYNAAPQEIAALISKVQSQTTHHPSNIAQFAALAAALDDQKTSVKEMREKFLKRRNLFLSKLKGIPGIHIEKPEGAFYLFVTISELFGKKTPQGKVISSSSDFCEYFLNEYKVAIVPGAAFGNDHCIRISYAAEDSLVEEAAARLVQAVQSLK